MIQEHRGRLALYHIDLYRLEQARLDDLGLREYLFSEGVAAVEWFERLREAPALDCLSIRFGYAGANTRLIELSAVSNRYCELIERLKTRFGCGRIARRTAPRPGGSGLGPRFRA